MKNAQLNIISIFIYLLFPPLVQKTAVHQSVQFNYLDDAKDKEGGYQN